MATMDDKNFDLVIAGGGVAGTAAAIAAGRMGAAVLLLEQGAYLGGSLTSGGVGPMMTFHAGGVQVIRGVMEDIVQRLVQRGYSKGHIHDTTRYVSHITPFNAEGLKLVLDEMTEEVGCTVLLHTFIGGVLREGNKITGLNVCNKDGAHTVRGKMYIDATGDGDVMAWAGTAFVKGRPQDGAAQPMTLKMKYAGVDTARLKAYVRANMQDFPRLSENRDLLDSDEPLALAGFDSVFKKAKAAGELSIPREDVLMFETDRPGEFIINTTRILNADATNAWSLSQAEREGRRQAAQLDRFLRRYAPGFENALLEFTGPSVGVRGSRQLVGRYTLTAQDIVSAKMFESRVCLSGYPIDIHNPSGEGTTTHYIGGKNSGGYYSIPYEIMVPQDIDNLLVAGRCASASFEAQASIRLTPSVGGLGQAAGIAAVMAGRAGISVKEVDVPELQQVLAGQGVLLNA